MFFSVDAVVVVVDAVVVVVVAAVDAVVGFEKFVVVDYLESER